MSTMNRGRLVTRLVCACAIVLTVFCSNGYAGCVSLAGPLRDANGRFAGSIDAAGKDKLEARDCQGHLVGRYDAKSNQTRDRNGKLVGTGYWLPRLVPDCN